LSAPHLCRHVPHCVPEVRGCEGPSNHQRVEHVGRGALLGLLEDRPGHRASSATAEGAKTV
jgi:hypothetical protein